MISLTIKAEIDNLGKLSRFLHKNLKDSSCPEKIIKLIELSTEEIFVNIVKYAYTAGQNKTDVIIEFRNKRSGSRNITNVTVSDYGEPFDPLKTETTALNIPINEREPGGLGLLLVKRSMDRVEYEYKNGMNRMVIEKIW